MGRLILAQFQTVPDHGPGGLLGHRGLDPVFLEETELMGHDDGGAVRQRDDAEADLRRFRSVGAVAYFEKQITGAQRPAPGSVGLLEVGWERPENSRENGEDDETEDRLLHLKIVRKEGVGALRIAVRSSV